jgi:hypothetical protein
MTTQSTSPDASMLNHALDHARCGLPVFPCRLDKTPFPGADRGANGDKIEKSGGLYKATTDEATITAWWARWPNAMIGLPMGKASGLFAIDPDAPKQSGGVDGRVELAKLEGLHGSLDTLTTNTPSGGNHKFFNWRNDRPITNGEGDLKGLGINVRGEGGYVIVPPSVRADGRTYEYERSAQFIADAPEWLYDLISPKMPAIATLDSPPLAPADDQRSISELALANVIRPQTPTRNERAYCDRALVLECNGLASTSLDRNIELNNAALALGSLIGPGRLSESEVYDALIGASVDNGYDKEHGRAATRATIRSGLAKGMQQPRIITTPRNDFGLNDEATLRHCDSGFKIAQSSSEQHQSNNANIGGAFFCDFNRRRAEDAHADRAQALREIQPTRLEFHFIRLRQRSLLISGCAKR